MAQNGSNFLLVFEIISMGVERITRSQWCATWNLRTFTSRSHEACVAVSEIIREYSRVDFGSKRELEISSIDSSELGVCRPSKKKTTKNNFASSALNYVRLHLHLPFLTFECRVTKIGNIRVGSGNNSKQSQCHNLHKLNLSEISWNLN